eukprot:CAMPEP_0175623526 /NCGR_PEP_ID=MMETSP0096-20121207/69476_1 /TAXON_ID=311494 /ORGANISM="Alexandrium monilatum, Strain CCMP3105" /LENGTH=302 /DNA_ID=CAMNT_0016928789 /DNA_START=50 /DNA_END=954 /DNA_ORIENTATION=+
MMQPARRKTHQSHAWRALFKKQFHKTKLCVFHKKNKCALGSSCPFAHTREELQPAPDLAKTKLCYNFFRRRCNDRHCKFAHGYQELRATTSIYKTELCRWWTYGGCKAGSSCRYAHGIEELRRMPYTGQGDGSMEGMPFTAEFPGMEGMEDGQDYGESASSSYMLRMQAMDTSAPLYEQAEESYEAYSEEEEEPQAEAPQQHNWQEAKVETRPKAAPVPSESLDDGISDMGLSDASFLVLDKPLDQNMLRRQQTAPPTPSTSFVSELPRLPGGDNIALRVKGTFMEALNFDIEAAHVPMHRS